MAKRGTRLTDEQAQALAPYLTVAMDGLRRSRWRFGDPYEYLVAPIVLQAIIQVSRDLRFRELLDQPKEAASADLP